MKIRVCFLVMALAPLFYYGVIQLAPAGRAATVSTGFHQLGKNALAKIENAQDSLSEPDSIYEPRLAAAENALATTNTAAVSAADRREYMQLVAYLHDVKQDRILLQASNDPTSIDHEQTNAARESAERTFN